MEMQRVALARRQVGEWMLRVGRMRVGFGMNKSFGRPIIAAAIVITLAGCSDRPERNDANALVTRPADVASDTTTQSNSRVEQPAQADSNKGRSDADGDHAGPTARSANPATSAARRRVQISGGINALVSEVGGIDLAGTDGQSYFVRPTQAAWDEIQDKFTGLGMVIALECKTTSQPDQGGYRYLDECVLKDE